MPIQVIITIIRQTPETTLIHNTGQALQKAAEIAKENLGGDADSLDDYKQTLTKHGRIQEGDFEVWLMSSSPEDESPETAALRILRNALLPGPDQDQTLLEKENFDADGIPHDGDLYRECANDDEAAHWVGFIDDTLKRQH